MKFTLAIFAILTISSAVLTQTAPAKNCVGTTTTWCVACDGTNCTSCQNGWLSSSKCAAATTTVANCMKYTDATTCDMCNYTHIKLAADGSCATPTTAITNCAFYQGIVAATTTCGACAVGTHPQGDANANFSGPGVNTIASCASTAVAGVTPVPNCAANFASNAPGAAGTAYTPACKWCSAGFVMNAAGTSCTAEGTNTGCAIGTIGTPNTCTACHPTTHQMTEANKCTTKPGSTYSAILSVASMIVALLFANF